MAKKKRKHFIKLNNKIKSLFNNKPFEDAVATFDDNTLYGLSMLLGKENSSISKTEMIKFIRRVWSEGNYSIRKTVVDFLEDIFKDKKREKQDKVDLILSHLKDEGATPQEEESILSDLMDKKISKITKDKVLRKLFYIRMREILDDYSQKLDIDFVGNDTIEFIAPHAFLIDDRELKINFIHSINMDIGLKELISMPKDEAIEFLKKLKKRAIELKEIELKEFLEKIKDIEYINEELLYKIFSNLHEPIKELFHCPIPINLIKKIVKSKIKDVNISLNREDFLISKSFKYEILNRSIDYDINIIYEKSVLYNLIWSNSLNSIKDDINTQNQQLIESFEYLFSELIKRMRESIYPLELSDEELSDYAISFLEPHLNSNRTIMLKDKLLKRVLYRFNDSLKDLKERKKREILLAKTIRDFKQLFPVARSLNREIIFNVGPTNSGKTYNALKELKKADTGVYLAPLRLLALEGYEELKQSGIKASLITGEEEIIDEESTHISSTIEMLNSDVEVDVCVIDEIQMIDDRDRGWAWANALIGAPAKKVILTGSSDALKVVQEIAKYLDEPLKIVEYKRINELKLLPKPTPIKKLEEATAIVTFSRKEVLALKSKISQQFRVSVIYGNLSPEVRREEARRFREGESQVLIATDAISMGLNLPIKTILFAKDNKFDGLQRRTLHTSEVLQISGRAGRYGLHEKGYVGALDHPTLSTIQEKFKGKLKEIELPISVMASLEHVLLIGEILQTDNLYHILEFFASNMEFDGPFVAANIDSMLEIAKIVDEYNLDLVSKYHLACAPVSIKSPYLEKVFHRYLKLLEENKDISFIELKDMPKKAISYSALLNAEDRVKEVSLYLWLSYKFGDKFKDTDIARETRDKLNGYIERSLRESNFTKSCNRCGKELDLSYKFSICDNCYNKQKRGFRRVIKRRKSSDNKENKRAKK